MSRSAAVVGSLALVAFTAAVIGWTVDGARDAAPAAKSESRLAQAVPFDASGRLSSAASPVENGASGGRGTIQHALPGFKWFGRRDESRLPSRPLGSYSDVIETEDGVVLILDGGSTVVYEHDPATRSTTIVGDHPIPSITPRATTEEPEDIDIRIYDDPVTMAGRILDASTGDSPQRPNAAR